MKRRLFLLSSLGCVVGCSKRVQREEPIFAARDNSRVIVLVFDLSGSFAGMMGGRGYRFAMEVINRYFKETIGSSDRIVIAQISGADRALLFDGTPLHLRQEFPSASAFKRFLEERADPGGSRVMESVRRGIEYVLSDGRVRSGAASSAVFVLSDLMDNTTDAGEEQRLKQALSDYAQHDGVMGLYWVDTYEVPRWRTLLEEAGLKQYVIESDIVARPELPNFEES